MDPLWEKVKMIRTGACKVVEVFASTETEIDEELEYLVGRAKSLSDGPMHILAFKAEEWDDEINKPYWMGVVLHDFFLGSWVEPEDFDPRAGVAVVDFAAGTPGYPTEVT
jgi:hypothetical protein